MKAIIEKEMQEYPYKKLVKIKINDKNIIYSLKNYISNILTEIFYTESVYLEKQWLGCKYF